MHDMFNMGWIRRTFAPLVTRAKKAGVNPHNQDSFLKWLRASRDDQIRVEATFIKAFMDDQGEDWADTVEDAIVIAGG